MADHFDALEFAGYFRRRWAVVAATCGVAALIAGAVSLLLPKRYTATASILIEAPAGNDTRVATAVSPVYLESLKTYEHLASSDSLFVRALEHLHLRESYEGTSIETLKRRVLKVAKLRETKILEISATLEDPAKAQALRAIYS